MASGYTVTGVTQTQALDQSGHLQDMVDIQFELDNGQGSGSVQVPLTTDWADAAEAAVKTRAESMLRLLAL